MSSFRVSGRLLLCSACHYSHHTEQIRQLQGIFLPLFVLKRMLTPCSMVLLTTLYPWWMPARLVRHDGLLEFRRTPLCALGIGFADDISIIIQSSRQAQEIVDAYLVPLVWCFQPEYFHIAGSVIPVVTDTEGFKLLGTRFFPSLTLEQQQTAV